jgi:hypothetical protein
MFAVVIVAPRARFRHDRREVHARTLQSKIASFNFGRMTKLAGALRPVLFLLLAFSLTGCFQFNRSSLEEEKDPHYLEGQRRVNSMDYDGAIESFEKALQTNPNSAAAHLELGLLYETRKNDPASAIYHYQRHLKLRPDSAMGDVVNQKIVGCKRDLAKSVAFVVGDRDIQRQIDKLTSTNALLKQQLDAYRAEFAHRSQAPVTYVTNYLTVTQYVASASSREAARPPLNESAGGPRNGGPSPPRQSRPSANDWTPQTFTPQTRTSPRGAANTSAHSTRVHTVQKGETVAAISRRYNVTISAIAAVNPGLNVNRVNAGAKIVIPAR